MKLLILTAITISILHFLTLPSYIAVLAKKTQMICQEMTPAFSESRSTISSLVCGKKIADPKHIFALQSTGLIHIFVVSAGHLVVISEFLAFIKWPRFFITFVLFVFTLITGLQAPCLRSLMALLIGYFLSHRKLILSGPQLVFLTGILTLALFPQWSQSFSLQLSWAAALALSITSLFRNRNHSSLQNMIITSFCVFIVLLPFMQRLGGLHPLTILWNITLGTLTAFLLFPLSILAFLNPFFLNILEFMMKPFWSILKLSDEFRFEPSSSSSNLLMGWAWILILHLLLHFTALFYQRTYKT